MVSVQAGELGSLKGGQIGSEIPDNLADFGLGNP